MGKEVGCYLVIKKNKSHIVYRKMYPEITVLREINQLPEDTNHISFPYAQSLAVCFYNARKQKETT